MGHDASGPEAIDLAIDQPGRVAELVLLNTYYGRAPTLRFPEMISLMADPAYQPLAGALLGDDAQRLWLLFHTGRQFGLEPGKPSGIGELSIFPQFFAAGPTADALAEIRGWTAGLPDALDRQDRRIAAGKLRILGPGVTVIFGADDPDLNPELAGHMGRLFTSARVHLLGGASHWPQWDQPQAVAGLILHASAEPGGPG